MKNNRILSALLAALLAAPAVVSCGETPSAGAEPAQTAAPDTAAAEETVPAETEREYLDDLPEGLDFGGVEIRVACQSPGYIELFLPEQTGEVVDDAKYLRTAKVEERLNVKMKGVDVGVSWGDYNPEIRKVLTAGDTSYDVVYCWQSFVSLAYDGLFLNLSDAPYLDISKPYWASGYLTNMMYDGSKFYFLNGDYSEDIVRYLSCMYFNKKLYGDIIGDPDDLYRTVIDGGWTMDKLNETISPYYSDLNGDGVKNEADRFGMSLIKQNASSNDDFLFNMGCDFSYRDSDGYPVLDPMGGGRGDKITSCLDRIIALRASDPVILLDVDWETECAHFREGNTGFVCQYIARATQYREMQDDWGLLTYPKYDESQMDYITNIWDAVSLTALPYNCEKRDAICAVYEAMAAEGSRSVVPVYYETELKIKYSRDSLTAQVIDILHDTQHSDFAYINSSSLRDWKVQLRSLVTSGKNAFISWWAKNESKIQKGFDAIIAASTEL